MSDIPVISIVDDDDSVREALASLMRSAGYIPKVFSSAGDFLNSEYFDETGCLILDVQMPGMTGIELQQHLLASKRTVPIIFISAHDDAQARVRALEAGAVVFLKKPFSDDALLEAINSCFATETGGDDDRRDPGSTSGSA